MTKEKISSTLICFIIWPLFSQSVKYSQNDFYSKNYHVEKAYVHKDDFVDSFALSLRISRIALSVTTFYNKKLTRKFNSLNSDIFDRQGRLVEQIKILNTGKKQKISKLNQRNFNENGKISSSSHYYYGHNYFKMFEYNDSSQLIKQIVYNHKGIYSTIETVYSAGNINYSESYRDKKGRLISRYHYYYYPDKQIRWIELSNKKGKILKVWDYSCDETGKALKKLKDTSKICTIKSYFPDGTIVTTAQSFNFSGIPWKTVQYMNANGKNIKYQYYRGKEEKLVYMYEYVYSGLKLQSRTEHFYGHHYFRKDIVLDTGGRIVSEISTVYAKKTIKKVYKTSYLYNEQGLMTEKNVFVNNRLKTNEKFTYKFFTKIE